MSVAVQDRMLPRLTLRPDNPETQQSMQQWVADFGWGFAGDDAEGEAISAIEILGLTAPEVQWLQVRQGQDLIYSLSSQDDRCGHLCTAGDLLAAMAVYTGHRGLHIEADHLRSAAALRDLRVRVGLRVAQPPRAQELKIRVQL